ncbi:hypothetical protein Glove_149g49 [Diversispora epigaea]|uniref:UBP-type domain-containing protein n=1 Tax=Diversispora epigaea TaxID=1348612 RepID=A0A397J2I1_9GLOM|nr:hypothetical protein Glove_149g49 [Diversispora epigaea]
MENTVENMKETREIFSITPKTDCPHIKLELVEIWAQKPVDVKKPCEICNDANENWRCIECSKVLCSRYVNEHMTEHYTKTNHSLAISFFDLSTWCYSCDSYVTSTILSPILEDVYMSKFGTLPPNSDKDSNNNGEGSSLTRS